MLQIRGKSTYVTSFVILDGQKREDVSVLHARHDFFLNLEHGSVHFFLVLRRRKLCRFAVQLGVNLLLNLGENFARVHWFSATEYRRRTDGDRRLSGVPLDASRFEHQFGTLRGRLDDFRHRRGVAHRRPLILAMRVSTLPAIGRTSSSSVHRLPLIRDVDAQRAFAHDEAVCLQRFAKTVRVWKLHKVPSNFRLTPIRHRADVYCLWRRPARLQHLILRRLKRKVSDERDVRRLCGKSRRLSFSRRRPFPRAFFAVMRLSMFAILHLHRKARRRFEFQLLHRANEEAR